MLNVNEIKKDSESNYLVLQGNESRIITFVSDDEKVPKVSNKGKKFSEETCRNMSISRKGRIITPEWREKLSEAGKGRIFSKEHKKKLSEAAKKRWSKSNKLINQL